MNDRCPLAWNADVVTWDTITVELTVNFNVNVNNSAYIVTNFPLADDSYSTQLSNSGSFTHTYTFSREDWNAGGVISNNAFQVGVGFDVTGDGAKVLPFARDVLARLFQNGYFDFSEAWNVAWAYNYTRVGPTVNPIPTNNSGTFSGQGALSVDLSLSASSGGVRTPSWSGGVFNRDSGTGFANSSVGVFADDFSGSTVIIPFPNWIGISDVGADVKMEDLRRVSDNGIDFGVTLTQNDSSSVASYWSGQNYVATSAVQNVTIAISCS